MIRRLFLISMLILLARSTPVFSAELKDILKQKISTSFVNTPLERVISVLSNQYGINIIVGGDAQGKVTINLSEVTLADALSAILKTQGYHFVMGNNVLYVKPENVSINGELETKVFNLHYLDGFHLKSSLKPMLSAKGKIEALLAETEKDQKMQRSNTLVVTDYWENIRQVTQVIEQMDKALPQIQIEVKLVEKIIGDDKKVGINLPRSFTVQAQGGETTAPITQSNTGSGGAQQALSAWYQISNNVGGLNLGVLTLDNLKLTLDMLAEDASSSLISKPSVTVLNDHKATVRIGTTIPVPEISRGPSGDLYSFKEKDVSMRLDVVPLIGKDEKITLKVHPIMEEIIGYTGPSEAQQPITSKREVETTVILNNGETLVIGGLIKNTETKNVSKVWLLGDIPILGYLFKHTSIKKQKSDLLIFITTKILKQK